MFDHWKDFLHPHEGNDHHPHAYRKASAIAMTCVVGFVLLLSAMQTGYVRQSSNFLSSVLPSVLVEMTNENRSAEGLEGLRQNDTLARAAKLKAEHMAENDYFAHDSPSGVTPWEWFREVDYTYNHAGENLAVNFSDSKEVVKSWMESRPHRKNILEQDFTEIGIGTAKGEYKGKQTVFVVQMFGTPDKQELAQRQTSDSQPTDQASQQNGSGQQSDSSESQATSTGELVAQLSEQVEQVQDDVRTQQSVGGEQDKQTTADTETDNDSVSRDQVSRDKKRKTTKEPAETSVQPDNQPPTSTNQEVGSTSKDQFVAQKPNDRSATITDKQLDKFATPTPVAAGSVAGQSGVSLAPFESGWFNRLLSQPQLVLQTTMYTLIGLVLFVLLVSIVFEVKHHHFWMASMSLLTIMLILAVYAFAQDLLFVETIIA